jgi:pimeloyl-ACP methyl ester carboxylesterase
VAAATALAVGAYAWNNTTSSRRAAARVRRAGFAQRRATLASGVTLSYAEGPDTGPPLLLVHGQGSARQTYDRALPALARNFHVFVVDVAGHGDSDRTPDRYTVHLLGADLVDFIRNTVHEPVIVSGHSSGGLLAAWVAAEAPDLVSAVLFEDPPFFSTDPERFRHQFNYVDLDRPAHEFLEQLEHAEHPRQASQAAHTDFASWYIEHNAWIGYFGGGRDGIVRYAQRLRRAHPERPLTLWFFPPTTNESFAHMNRFDPQFADAFYELRWQAGFEQSATLARITQPTILVHANWRITEEGILEGAMTDEDAARASALLAECRLQRVDTGHGFHFEDPRTFVALVEQLSARVPRSP